jgi:hypothetical protein
MTMVPSFFHHEMGDYAHSFPFIAEYSSRHSTHQTLLASSVDESITFCSHQLSKFESCLNIGIIYLSA